MLSLLLRSAYPNPGVGIFIIYMRYLLLPILLLWVCYLPCQAQSKPNILWITIEDTSPQFIGCYGNREARTPVIDQLASEGIRFTNAFSTGTVCSPSRTALITGVKTYRTGTGNHRSNYPIPPAMRGFPYYMQQAGYYTTNNSKTDYNVANPEQFIKEAWNESSYTAGWWNRKPGQPFFAVFNFMDSHQSRTMTDSYEKYSKEVLDQLPEAERIGENDFKMPPFYHDTPAMRKQMARVYNSIRLTDIKIGNLLSRLEKDNLRDSTIIIFFADHGEGIPRGKTNGIGLGYRVPLVVWLPPMYRHLSPWRETGKVAKELLNFEDMAPTMIHLAEGKIPDHMNGKVFLGKNRTVFADHVILSSDRSDNGIDLTRAVTDGKYLYARNYMPYMPEVRYIRYMEIGEIKQVMRQDLATNQLNLSQRKLFESRPAEVLYDLEKDEWEMTNLVDAPIHKAIADRMRRQLHQEIVRSRDIHFLPEYELAEIAKTSTAYDFRLGKKRFPIEKILGAANLSGKKTSEALKEQIQLLQSPEKIVRYWAVIGLRSQDKSSLVGHKAEILAAMEDTYPPVVILASAIAYEVFGEGKAQENLGKFASDENTELALLAINELLYVSNKNPFIGKIKEIHATMSQPAYRKNPKTYPIRAACMDFLGSLGLVPNTPEFAE